MKEIYSLLFGIISTSVARSSVVDYGQGSGKKKGDVLYDLGS